MGEGTTGVERRPPEQLEREIETIRGNLAEVVKELDRRRHEFLDWRMQLKRHASALWIAAAGAGTIVAGMIILSIWRSQRRERPVVKAQRLRLALARMMDKPERVARPRPRIVRKFAAAAASAAAGLLAQKISQRVLSSPIASVPAPRERHLHPAGDGPAQPELAVVR